MSNNNKLCDSSKLNPGDWVSRISYMKIVEIKNNGSFVVENQHGFKWTIGATILEAECNAANQYVQTKKVNRAELAHKLKGAGHMIFSVEFEKQPTVTSVEQQLISVPASDLTVVKKRRKLCKGMLVGPLRTLIGHLKNSEEHMGRSMVRDLEISRGYNERQVDHRKINWIILNNTRYEKK